VKFWRHSQNAGLLVAESESKGSSVAYHALELVQHAPGEKQPNGVSRHQPPERVANNAQLLDAPAPAPDLFQFLLDLEADALAAELDAIIGEVAAVALRDEDVDLLGREPVAQGFGGGPHVVRVAP
jgi:hypothetical protein